MKRFTTILIAALMAVVLSGCSLFDDTKTYIIASEMGAYNGAWDHYETCHFAKEKYGGDWFSVDDLVGMEFEEGYEYVIEGVLTTSREQHEQGIADAESFITVEHIISKTAKTTVLPEEMQYELDLYQECIKNGSFNPSEWEE